MLMMVVFCTHMSHDLNSLLETNSRGDRLKRPGRSFMGCFDSLLPHVSSRRKPSSEVLTGSVIVPSMLPVSGLWSQR